MLEIISIIFIFLSLLAILFIFARKIPYLVSIDLGKIPVEKQAMVKRKLIEIQFSRKLKNFWEKVLNIISPILNPIKEYFRNKYFFWKEKILAWEVKYRKKYRDFLRTKPELLLPRIQILLEEGRKLKDENRLEEAEERFIEVIALDPENTVAYENLGYIYLAEKNYEYALETFKFLLKLNLRKKSTLAEIASSYLDLGLVYKAKGENKKAFENFQKACQLEPNNPKNLDLFIETSIILKKKNQALEALKKIREVNPENLKILEFEERIRKI